VDCSKKEEMVLALFYVVAIRLLNAVYQISPLSVGKSKTILQKPKIGLLLMPKLKVVEK